MQVRRLIQGTTPLLISIPHMGTFVPPDLQKRMTEEALKLPDTDWHLDRLYGFARDMGVSILMSSHSRYVIDLNRPQEDTDLYPGQVKTGLCPLETFSGEKIYLEDEEPDNVEKANRIGAYWLPYHDTLAAELKRIKDEFGYAILYDAHSIKSEVSRLFDGVLPDLNVGTAKGTSCAAGMAEAVMTALQSNGYSSILNGRFVGGYITRHYGQPDQDIHSIQMELACKNYMAEAYPYLYRTEKAENLQKALGAVLESLLSWGESAYSTKSK
jgi:N-formylglutamate deformylase